MLNITQLKLYPSFSRSIFIPVNEAKKYSIIFYPENSSLIEAYPALQIRKQYVKRATYLSAKLPILRNTMDKLMQYKIVKLIPFSTQKPKENVFIDCSQYLDSLDASYGKASYKRPNVLPKILNYITRCQNYLPNSSILMYYVDMSKDVNPNIFFRRAYALFHLAKTGGGVFSFDIVCLVAKTTKGIIYTPIYNKKKAKPLNVSRIYSILKRFIPKPDAAIDEEEIIEPEIKPIKQSEAKPEKKSALIDTIHNWASGK